MAHPLDGFIEAKERRGRYLIVKEVDGKKSYYVGFGAFTEDRDSALTYAKPADIYFRLGPDCTIELA